MPTIKSFDKVERKAKMKYQRDILGWTYRQIGEFHKISHQRVTEIIGPLGEEGKAAQRQREESAAALLARQGATWKDVRGMKGRRGITRIKRAFSKIPHKYLAGPRAVTQRWVENMHQALTERDIEHRVSMRGNVIPLWGGKTLLQVMGTDTFRSNGLYHFNIRSIDGDVIAFGMTISDLPMFYLVPASELKTGSVYIYPDSSRWSEYRNNYAILEEK